MNASQSKNKCSKKEASPNLNQVNDKDNNKEIENHQNNYDENIIDNPNLEESNNFKNEKNIRIQEIMIGDRRLERFDGAEYNNPNLNQNQNQNININYIMQNEEQFSNEEFISPDQVNINGFNNSENNFIPFNVYNDQIYQNSIYNNFDELQVQEELNPQLFDIPHPITQSPNQSHNFISNISNYYDNSPKNNSHIVIKDKDSFKLFSSNNNKENENNYYPKKYNISEGTAFMTNKNDEYVNNNINNSNLQQNQIYPNAINSTQISQQIDQEYFDSPNNEKDSKIMQQNISQQPQMINQNQFKYRNEESNFNVNVLYPKPGYGNSEEEQSKLRKKKKKKKKIKYVRRLKPVVEQHFDVQIIQVPDISNSDQQNQEPQSQYLNNFPPMILPGHGPFPQKVIPHIPDKYKIKKNNNNTKQNICNDPKPHPESSPMINNNSVKFDSNFGEQQINNNDNKFSCRPTQTLINITPMRTIYRPDYFNGIPYSNNERHFKTEGYREYRPLTPIHHMNNEKSNDEFERYGCSSVVPKRKNSFSFYHKDYEGERVVHSYNNKDEMKRELNCTCCAYDK